MDLEFAAHSRPRKIGTLLRALACSGPRRWIHGVGASDFFLVRLVFCWTSLFSGGQGHALPCHLGLSVVSRRSAPGASLCRRYLRSITLK
jgi:hypothetical protein